MQHAHQPVRQVGRGGEPGAGEGAHAVEIRRHVAHHARHRRERQRPGLGGIEHRLLVLLHVLRIGQRQALHHRQQPDQRAGHPPGLRPHQLGRVRIALLRHDRAAGGERIRQPDEPERRAEHQITISSAKRDRCIAEIAAAARNSSAKSRSDTASSELAAGRSNPSAAAVICPVDRERRAGQRRRAQRAFVQPPPRSPPAARDRAPASRHRPAGGGRTSPAARSADG